MLQPDKQDEMLFYLRQGQARNYTFSNGFLNSTNPYPVSPPFEAPPSAVLINGLWFSSLIVSLATASFGMLAKQWLHEYLASDSMSPKRRIIERHLRQPELVSWKVYEIAGVLPMLLHVALCLFFVGLCVFTTAVDKRLGRSSFTLVAGWAFFILTTSLAPLLWPRCPYKIPTFSTMLTLGRTLTRPILGHIIVAKATATETCTKLVSSLSKSPSMLFVLQRLVMWPGFTHQLLAAKHVMAAHIAMPKALESGGRFASRGIALLEEKKQIDRISQGNDLEFLLAVDIAVSDDTMLRFMESVIEYSRPSPDATLAFVISILRRRLGDQCISSSVSSDGPFPVLDLSLLSYDAWLFAMNVITTILQMTDPSGFLLITAQPRSCWPQAAVWIVLSHTQYVVPDMTYIALLDYFIDTSTTTQLSSARTHELLPFIEADPEALGHLSRRFVTALSYIDLESARLPPLQGIISLYTASIPQSYTDRRDWRDWSSVSSLDASTSPILDDRTQSAVGHLLEFLELFGHWYLSKRGAIKIGNEGETVLSVMYTLCKIHYDNLRPLRSGLTVQGSFDNPELSARLISFLSGDFILKFMLDVARACHPPSSHILPIVAMVIRQSLGSTSAPLDFNLPFPIPDLRCLPSSVHSTVTKIVAETLQQHAPDKGLRDSPPWVKGAVAILISPSKSALPPLPLRMLRRYLCDKSGAPLSRHRCPELSSALSPYISERRAFAPLSQHLLAASIHAGENESPCVHGVFEMYRILLVKTFDLEYIAPEVIYGWDLSHLLLSNLSLFQNPSARPILDDVWDYLQALMKWNGRLKSSPSKPKLSSSFWGIEDAFALLTVFGNHDDPSRWAFVTEHQAGIAWVYFFCFLRSTAAVQPHRRLRQLNGQSILGKIIDRDAKG
jgi:hypothetical protein